MTLNPTIFGPGVSTRTKPASIVFVGGGIGDYINWCAAIEYMKHEINHLDLNIFAPEMFIDVAKYLYADVPRWNVYLRSEVNRHHVKGSSRIEPRPGSQLFNACGAHLMDLGFAYFLCMSPAPKKYNFLPRIDYDHHFPVLDLLPENFCVFTPGATTDIREMPLEAFNKLVDYCIEKGVTPVFLGKQVLMEKYAAKFLPYDFHKGLDLRERTNLLQATAIIKRAKFIIGMDNGLLHMAGCTTTPIIFGQNVTEVHHRDIRRKTGLTINVTSSRELTPCIGCQSRMRYVPGHDFRKCFFEGWAVDRKCLTDIFSDNLMVWKRAIDYSLEHGEKLRNAPAKSLTFEVPKPVGG